MWLSIIRKNNQDYFLGAFETRDDANNMAIIAKTFSSFKDFRAWYPNRKDIYNWLLEKCNSINMPCYKIIQAIYDGYYGELYNDLNELNMFINDFKFGYEF